MFPVPAVTIPLFPKPLRNEQIAISRKFPAVQSALRDFSACRWEHKREKKNYEKGDCVLRIAYAEALRITSRTVEKE